MSEKPGGLQTQRAMRVVHGNPIPRVWKNHPAAKRLLLEADIAISSRTRLKAKLLVFETKAALRQFWNKALPYDGAIGRDTAGVVNSLGSEVCKFGKGGESSKPVMKCDPRYFCIIGLTATDLCFEVICHEAVHAAFSYAKRTKARNLWAAPEELDEEYVCYPAGKIASSINRLLYDHDLYKFSRRISQEMAV